LGAALLGVLPLLFAAPYGISFLPSSAPFGVGFFLEIRWVPPRRFDIFACGIRDLGENFWAAKLRRLALFVFYSLKFSRVTSCIKQKKQKRRA